MYSSILTIIIFLISFKIFLLLTKKTIMGCVKKYLIQQLYKNLIVYITYPLIRLDECIFIL